MGKVLARTALAVVGALVIFQGIVAGGARGVDEPHVMASTSVTSIIDEPFEWGIIGPVNTALNQWQGVNDENGKPTAWESHVYGPTGTSLSNTFLATTREGGSTMLRMEAYDDVAGSFKWSIARTRVAVPANLTSMVLNFSVRGARDDHGYDNSLLSIRIISDPTTDIAFGAIPEPFLRYVMDDNNFLNNWGTIDNLTEANGRWSWVNVSKGWDNQTWYHFSLDVLADWSRYLDHPFNASTIEVRLENGCRRDGPDRGSYMRSTWDNVTIEARVPGEPEVPPGMYLLPGNHDIMLDGLGCRLFLELVAPVYVNVLKVPVPGSDPLLALLPDGLLPAIPAYFRFSFSDPGAVASAIARIYYSQPGIASDIFENGITVLGHVDGSSSWSNVAASLDKAADHVTFEIDATTAVMYLVVGPPKNNYDIVVIATGTACIAGIAIGGSYGYRKRKAMAVTVQVPRRKNSKSIACYGPDAFATHGAPAPVPRGTPDIGVFDPAMVVKGKDDIPRVDLEKRAENAARMEAEVPVEKRVPSCIVHKGPASGFTYTCSACGTTYCLACAQHVGRSGDGCWTCGAPVETLPGDPLVRDARFTIFGDDVLARVASLHLDDDLAEDLLVLLKDVPPGSRVAYLDDMFREDHPPVDDLP